MSNIRLGNGQVLQAYVGGQKFTSACDCIGAEVGMVLSTMGMVGSNLFNMYSGARCSHGNPIKAAPVAYIVENYKEESLKFKGKSSIKHMLEHVMKGSIALVFFRSNGNFKAAALDLYLTDKLWINSGIAEESADEMWVWILGGRLPKTGHAHHSKSHRKQVVVF